MAKFNKAVITKRGDNEIARAVSNLDTITFTRIGISSTVYDYSTLKDLTKIAEVSSIPINNVTKKDTNYVNITAILTNENLQNGYYIETLGLFAKNKAGEEYLYSLTTAEVSDFIPADRNITKSKIYIDFVSYVGASQNVDVKTNMQGILYREDIENVVYKSDIANVVYKSEVDAIAEKYIQRSSSKNLLVNSTFLSTVTEGAEIFSKAGIYKFKDMFFGYSQYAQQTNYTVSFHPDGCSFLEINNVAGKTGTSYIMTYFVPPQILSGKKGTLSFLINTAFKSAKITVSITENQNVTEKSFILTPQCQKIELTTTFLHKAVSNVIIGDLVYIKITLSDANNTLIPGESIYITQLQYEVGEKSTPYIQKSHFEENNEVLNYIFPIPKGVQRLTPEASIYGYLPFYGLKPAKSTCYVNNFFEEGVDYRVYDMKFGEYYSKHLVSGFVQYTRSYVNTGMAYLQFRNVKDGQHVILPERLNVETLTRNSYISYYHNEN